MIRKKPYSVFVNLHISSKDCDFLTFFISAQATTSNTACEGVTCGNKGFCVPSTLYNKGYWCECDDGWVGQNCGHPQPTVVCGDTEISITIDQGIVEELSLATEEDYVYFGNSDPHGTQEHAKCSARLENEKFKLKLQAPFFGCGTQVINQVSYKFNACKLQFY